MESSRDTSGSTGQLSSAGSTGGGMHHSLSTPAGVDGAGGARTPPATPKKGGKMLAIRVQMLDDTITIFQVQAKALGKVLFEQVCKQLHLLEADYFGLDYQDLAGTRYWLDLQKPVSRQLGLSLVDPLLYFCVKFYTPDPGQLEEEYTRYLYCLQVKRDLSHGLMHCNDNTAALMASYIVQAECGDYVSEDYPDHTYLSSYKFVPHQDQEMERKIMENHKKHSGQSPAEADLNLLETARRCELYGIKLHPAKDHENVPLNLAVAHCGIVVYQHITKINTFSWAKIRKLSFKRKKFLIKLHPEGYGYYKDTVEFFFEGRNECKNFWKKCVENHGFFRCSSVKNISRHKTRVLSRGSSFRYSGKTQKQIVEFVRDNYVKRQTFQRSASFRHSSAHSSANNMHTSSVGNSISAHPLLPLADSNLSVEASKLSASLGAMGAAPVSEVVGPISPTTKSVCHPRVNPTSWSSAPDTRPTTTPVQMMNSHSPPPMMLSDSPVISTTTTPQHIPYATVAEDTHTTTAAINTNMVLHNSPVAVHAAVHRADTGTNNIITTITTRTISNRPPSQTQSQNDIDNTPPDHLALTPPSPKYRHVWQRSASCRELYDFSFEDSGQAKRRIKPDKIRIIDERKLESPITRYDDHRAIYAQSHNPSLEIHQDIIMPDEKVYSSSYPGTTSYSQESVEDPGNYDLNNSQDDLSHDSYELLERSDDDYSTSGDYKYAKTKSVENTRSCSLDSGNYIPSDTDSEPAVPNVIKTHKCKSSNDVQDIFAMDDPRDLPREIIPRKSDGNYYKTFKTGSRTSSLESKSDYYETKPIKLSKESLKKHRKRHSVGSRTSSQESKSDYDMKKTMRRKSNGSIGRRTGSNGSLTRKTVNYDSRTSSQESKSEYYDANSEPKTQTQKIEYDRKIQFERNYGIQKPKHDNAIYEINRNLDPQIFREAPISNLEAQTFKETSHVHSISLQNVETEQNLRSNRMNNLDQNTVPRTQKSSHQLKSQNSLDNEKINITNIWPESIVGIPTQIRDMPTQIREVTSQIREVETQIKDWSAKQQQSTRSTESESNIFSFDEDKIQSLQDEDPSYAVVPNLDGRVGEKKNYRDVFVEIEPRKLDLTKDSLLHQPIERTKSDPNNLAWQRLNSNSRRLLLKHQKSIDLTPAESSDEDYLYKQIPSAPPIMKYRGTHFEMPTAEFGHFDILKREIEGEKTKFEVPKRQFESLGVKTQSDFINLPPKNESDIPYILHKRHVMNGTSKEEIAIVPEIIEEKKKKPKSPVEKTEPFLFTQNIDLSKVDPVTLEVDKTVKAIHHMPSPKRDITRIDPALLETLNSKLSQIESDSPTSSKTESLKPQQKIKILQQIEENRPKIDLPKLEIDKIKDPTRVKTDTKPKRIIKARMQPGKKGKNNKTKVRITSFSSDDESLDSDDVFGSTEATPTKLEFSPPQMRKEMVSILKYESERKYLQYTMSSTEVEGSPPTTRKTEVLYDRTLDLNYQTELRRISERSLSIPSSEDDFNIKTSDMLLPVFEPEGDDITLTLETLEENPELDKSVDDTIEQITVQELLKADDWRNEGPDLALDELDEEKEKEKIQLNEDIERDILDLHVPLKTKITEICSPSSRNRGQSSMLYAHARLNLSEGSAFSVLQKQEATESPLSARRAKSLDTAVISVNRLPPYNSFSSKDDTVEEEDNLSDRFRDSDKSDTDFAVDDIKVESPEIEKLDIKTIKPVIAVKPKIVIPKIIEKPKPLENKPTSLPLKDKPTSLTLKDKPTLLTLKDKQKSIEKDQIVPDVNKAKKRATLHTKPLQSKTNGAKNKTSVVPKVAPSTSKTISKVTPKTVTKETKIISKEKVTQKPPISQKTAPTKTKALPPKSLSLDKSEKKSEDKTIVSQKSLPSQNSIQLLEIPEIKRTKSQELESCKRPTAKEKAKSLEKLEFKRSTSKERTKSQDESDTDIVKRREYQQILYETAIKQTKTVKSPVKDILPVFPQVEEMVRERGGKLEISINTIENTSVNLEEAIIITKSPKRLDKKLIDQKLTKSLEINLTDEVPESPMQRLGKSLDLDTRNDKSEELEFDFKSEAINDLNCEELSIQDDLKENNLESLDTDTEETLQDTEAAQLILEGTSLDIWLSVDQTPIPRESRTKERESRTKDRDEKLKKITIVEKASNTFFEDTLETKPPDLAKIETKSSSDSQSIMESLSLGNSLEMKYMDDSGDSSNKSDTQHLQELQKASLTVEKLLMKKMKNRRQMPLPVEEIEPPAQFAEEYVMVTDVIKKEIDEGLTKEEICLTLIQEEIADTLIKDDIDCTLLKEEIDNALVRITSEEESLTEVSEIKCEQDNNFLGVNNNHKDAFLRLSVERSRSEENTGSWMTVDCEEYIGTESFEYDNAPLQSPEKGSPVKTEIKEDMQENIEEVQEVSPVVDEIKLETDLNLLSISNIKLNKIDLLKRSSDQSRSSDTTGSWTSGEKDLSPGKAEESSVSCSIGIAIGLSQTIERFASRDQLNKTSPDMEPPRSPRSPRICVLGRAFTIDEDSSLFIRDKSDSSSDGVVDLQENLSVIQENDEKDKFKKKPYPFEEKWSLDSELTQRLHKKITKKLSSSEKNSFSSVDDSLSEKRKTGSLYSVDRLSAESRNSIDTESSSGSIGLAARGLKTEGLIEPSCTWKRFPLESGSASSSLEEIGVDQDMYGQEYFLSRENSADLAALQDVYKIDPDATPTADIIDDDLDKYNYPLGGFNLGLGNDVFSGFNTSFLSRTLSRISERSTNSEKSSVDEDSTKASTQSDSLNDESLGSMEQQVSLSSDPPSNAHGSHSDKKSNGAKKSKSKKECEKFNYDQVPNISNLLQRQISDDRRTSAEMADLSIDDIEIITSERGLKLRRQDSDDTIIDEERDKEGSSSQESDEWPLPDIPRSLLALHETPSSDNSQPTTQLYQPPTTVTQITNIPKSFGLRGSLKSQDSEQWPSPPSSIHEPLNVETHFITPPEEACKVIIDSNTVSTYDNDSNSLSDENKTLEYDVDSQTEKTHTYENVATDQISEISESLSVGPSGVKIVLEAKSGSSGGSNSEELNLSNLNDDVFTDALDHSGSKNELRPPTVMRRSTTSDDSSHSGRANNKNIKDGSPKGSHSSYSEEDATSSMGTTLEDGTVRFALKPTKCTHSSHSEDTSIALSLSEWSNSTTTVKFQNLSTSNSGKSVKSDDNSLTDIAHSFSEWSSSNSTLKAQSLQFQKLSSSTGDSTLTEILPTISDWSSSDSKTLVPQVQTYTPQSFCFPDRTSISRLGSSFDDLDTKDLKSPQNIPSEDLLFTMKSTERPILIPPVLIPPVQYAQVLSDEKSTESSSMEQRTVHTQRFDLKQKYQKSFKSSCERPVKVPLKLSKCSPYYSSSLSSESTPMTQSMSSKSGTIPLTRTHRKPIAKSLFQARSPPSENDSTSSMESPRCKSEPRDRRGYRRRRHTPQKRHSKTTTDILTKDEQDSFSKEEYFFVDQEACQYNEYIRNRSMEELACGYHYDNVMTENSPFVENLEEGYYPDGDSQSGSDIFRMERDDDEKLESEGFDVSSIPPPLIEDDFETDRSEQI